MVLALSYRLRAPAPTDVSLLHSENGATMTGNRSITFIAAVSGVALLHFGAPFFIPLLIALMIAYALSPVVDAITRSPSGKPDYRWAKAIALAERS